MKTKFKRLIKVPFGKVEVTGVIVEEKTSYSKVFVCSWNGEESLPNLKEGITLVVPQRVIDRHAVILNLEHLLEMHSLAEKVGDPVWRMEINQYLNYITN